jgi:uncharacterized membrane protein
MAHLEARVTVQAPADRVWTAVHEDLEAAPRWTGYLKRAVLLDGDGPGPGRRVRYDLDLPGGISLTLLPTLWDRPHRCEGEFVDSPLEGTWSYVYTESGGATDVAYTMDYRLRGLLRFAGGLLDSRYEEGVQEGMRLLKQYVEEER